MEAGNDGSLGARTWTLLFATTQQAARLPYLHDSHRQIITVPPLGRSAVQRTWSGRCQRCSSRSNGKGHGASVCTREQSQNGSLLAPRKGPALRNLETTKQTCQDQQRNAFTGWFQVPHVWPVALGGLERGVLTEERVGEVRRGVMGTCSGQCTGRGALTATWGPGE